MKRQRLFALDPSLTCSGWALFDLKKEQLLGVGKLKPPGASQPLALRLSYLQDKVTEIYEKLNISKNDVLISEAATSMTDPSAAAKLEQVRGIFETLARARSCCVPGRIHPRTVQYELLGIRGRQIERVHVKSAATEVVKRLLQKQLERIGFDCSAKGLKANQDIIDAILVGIIAMTRVKAAEQGGIDLVKYFDDDNRSKRTARRGLVLAQERYAS